MMTTSIAILFYFIFSSVENPEMVSSNWTISDQGLEGEDRIGTWMGFCNSLIIFKQFLVLTQDRVKMTV